MNLKEFVSNYVRSHNRATFEEVKNAYNLAMEAEQQTDDAPLRKEYERSFEHLQYEQRLHDAIHEATKQRINEQKEEAEQSRNFAIRG